MSKNPTSTRLKTIAKNSPTHTFRNFSRILKYGIIGYGRNIWLSITSTIVMTLTLILLFVTIVASLVLSSTADAMREKIDITIYFKPTTSKAMLAEMTKTIKKDSNVKSAEYTTSEKEYEKFLQETKGDNQVELLETLKDEAMRELMLSSMSSTMRIKVHNAEDRSGIEYIVNNDPNFKENIDPNREPSYDTNDTTIDTIVNWSNIARIGGLALSALFLLISTLVIFNTIRMAIYSRSEEIYMEKLVGADNHFIRGPFLVEACISGIIAGVLGSTGSIIIVNTVGPKLESYDIDISLVTEFINSSNIILMFIAFIILGAIIALISSRLAVHKYLRKM